MPSRAPALLDALFDYAPIGLGFWDRDLRCVKLNPALAELNGVAVEETVGRTMPEVLGPFGERVEALFRQVLETGEALVNLELTGEAAARPGGPRQWRATYYPVFDDVAGEPLGVAATVIEVTGEREALSQAQAATALLDAVVDAAPVGISFLDLDLRYQRVNRAMAELAGVEPEAMLGRRPSEVAGEMGERAEALLTRALETGEPVYEQELGAEVAAFGETRYRAGSWFPVRGAAGEIVGVAAVVRDATERHRADRERQRLLKDAVNARARAEQAQREAEIARARTDFLAEAGRRMATSMDYESTLQEVAGLVVPRLADWCIVAMRRPAGTLETLALAHSDPRKVELAWDVLRRYPIDPQAAHGSGAVLRTGEPELTENITPEMIRAVARDEEHARLLLETGMRTMLIVPLRTPDGVIGTLSLVLTDEERRFSEDDVKLARVLADRASLHIRNALLYQERSHVARTLQAGLLPSALPEIPGIEIAAAYRAAGDEIDVGGDFYDAFAVREREWAVVIGDVVGKGAEAAAVTALARHAMRTAAMFEDEPREKLHALNRALLMEPGDPRFCTVLCGRVTPAAGGGFRVRMATGGHPAPRIVRGDGRVESPGLQGSLVGWLPDPEFEVADVHLGPGDLLLMYTDGAVEVRGRRAEYGERGLTEALASVAGGSAQEIVDGLLERILALHEGAVPDDVALLALRVRP